MSACVSCPNNHAIQNPSQLGVVYFAVVFVGAVVAAPLDDQWSAGIAEKGLEELTPYTWALQRNCDVQEPLQRPLQTPPQHAQRQAGTLWWLRGFPSLRTRDLRGVMRGESI